MRSDKVFCLLLTVMFVGSAAASVSTLSEDRLCGFTDFMADSHQIRLSNDPTVLQAEIQKINDELAIEKELSPQAYFEAYLWLSRTEQSKVDRDAEKVLKNLSDLQYKLNFLEGQARRNGGGSIKTVSSSDSPFLSIPGPSSPKPQPFTFHDLTHNERKQFERKLEYARRERDIDTRIRLARLGSLTGQARADQINQIIAAEQLDASKLENSIKKYQNNTALWRHPGAHGRVEFLTLLRLREDKKKELPKLLVRGGLAWKLLEKSRQDALRAKYALKADHS